MASKPNPKPEQYKAFEELAKRLVNVPKKDLDKEVQVYNTKKAKRKKGG